MAGEKFQPTGLPLNLWSLNNIIPHFPGPLSFTLSWRTAHNFSQISCISCQFLLPASDVASNFIEDKGSQKRTLQISSIASVHCCIHAQILCFPSCDYVTSSLCSHVRLILFLTHWFPALYSSQGCSPRNSLQSPALLSFLFLLGYSYQPTNVLLFFPSV